MKIWILTVGEHLPKIDGKNVRPWRSILLTQALLSLGHSVTRWTSTFNHSQKTHRFEKDTFIVEQANYKIILIKSPGYTQNISFQRLIDHIVLARKFKRMALQEDKPDLILCSLPTLELCIEAVKYGKKNLIPVVIDARDMWPDIFKEVFPLTIPFISKILLYPMYKILKNICKNATALSGISQPYVEWLLQYSNRLKSKNDIHFPMAYPSTMPNNNELHSAESYWESQGVSKDNFNVCLFATFENSFDIETVIEAAKLLSIENSKIYFILCGEGSNLSNYKNKSKGLNNIIYTDWIDSSKIWVLMRISSVGLLPYKEKNNFLLNITNKPIEYLSAGLPLMSSIHGVIGDYIEKYNCGVFYKDSLSLKNQLLYLEKEKNILKIMSFNALKLYKSDFVAEIVYLRMTNYLINMAQNNKYE